MRAVRCTSAGPPDGAASNSSAGTLRSKLQARAQSAVCAGTMRGHAHAASKPRPECCSVCGHTCPPDS
eukprot:10630456-Alexandrium_andersonii.AAC.1